jgi:oligopeptide/dipeptide ABC transporter ATP-binding protein
MTALDSEVGASDPGAILEVRGLHTDFHLRHSVVPAVDGISFTVGKGDCVGVVGESGCGKSTTGLSIMGLLPHVGHVRAGSILLNGRDLTTMGPRQMRQIRGNEVAMIYQDPMTSLNPTMTVGRQISEVVRLHSSATRHQSQDRALEVLDLVGIPQPRERQGMYPHQLSGGLRQRVMIAMALACEPSLLIADEPTTGLDVTIQAQILDLIDDLRQRLDMAVLLITHDMGVIAGRTDRVLVMYAGRIVEQTDTRSLFARMRHPYTRGLLESIPRLDQDSTQRLRSVPGMPPDLSVPIVGCRFRARCDNAIARCAESEPALVGSATHLAACYNPVSGPAPATPAMVENDVPEARSHQSSDVTPLLEVRHLVKEFPVGSGPLVGRARRTIKAVSDVSFSLVEGQTFGLVGESGSGKTTLGRLIAGLETPTSGTIEFEGEDVTALRGQRLRAHRRRLQLMFQDPYASLDPRMRIGATLREPLVIQRLGNRAEQDARVSGLLQEVGVAVGALDLYPHEFSGGQRQRIGLARALILNPQLIVADEPVSALDVSVQAQVLNLMKTLQQRHRLTYVVISHDLSVVRFLADVIGVMYLGKLVEIGPAREIYERTAHPYTRGLIESIPIPDPAATAASRRAAVQGELPSSINPPSGCRFRTRCPLAQEVCAEEEPPMEDFGDGHRAACHFPLQLSRTVTAAAGSAG